MPTTYAIPNGRTVMTAVTYTGTGATQTITTNFYPDFLWFKARSNTYAHAAFNSIVGRSLGLSPNQTYGESTFGTSSAGNDLASFNATGFTVGPNVNWNSPNASDSNPVVWAWNAGSGSNTTNTSGTITSTVSANATAGFSVATFTAQGSGNGTVGHGLSAAPSIILCKQRGSAGSWSSYFSELGNTKYQNLNTTGAAQTDSTAWNSTSPTSSVFTLGSFWAGAGTMVAYCWAQVAGFSQFGSYTGNGSADGPFIYTGFRPKYVMVKRTNTTGDWNIIDSSRNTYNVANARLFANTSDAETTSSNTCDLLSNGFKLRTTNYDENNSGDSYIYMSFAENPFKYSNAR